MNPLIMQAVRNGGAVAAAPAPAPTNEAETTALLARMTSQPSSARITAINDLIAGLKADGIWTKLSGFFDLAAEDSQQSLLDWTRSAAATNNGCAFTANAGYRCGGGSNWIDLGFSGASGRGETQDDFAAGAWCNVEGTASAANSVMMGEIGASRLFISANTNSVAEVFRANDATNDPGRIGAGRVGHRAVSRRDSANKYAYFNGALAFSQARPSTGVAGGNYSAFRVGATYNTFNDGLCFAWVAKGLTDTEISNLHSRLSTYKTAAGIA